jgi:thymidine kinase
MLSLYVGPMWASKSSALVSGVNRQRLARRWVLVCKPETDTRSEGIDTHDGLHLDATVLKADGSNMLSVLESPYYDALALDEVQFLPIGVVPIISRIALDRPVIAAGLDMDAFGVPFPTTAALLACAHRVTKLQAVCTRCGEDAFHSQRLDADGDAVTSGDQVVVGNSYTAVCPTCFVMA